MQMVSSVLREQIRLSFEMEMAYLSHLSSSLSSSAISCANREVLAELGQVQQTKPKNKAHTRGKLWSMKQISATTKGMFST